MGTFRWSPIDFIAVRMAAVPVRRFSCDRRVSFVTFRLVGSGCRKAGRGGRGDAAREAVRRVPCGARPAQRPKPLGALLHTCGSVLLVI